MSKEIRILLSLKTINGSRLPRDPRLDLCAVRDVKFKRSRPVESIALPHLAISFLFSHYLTRQQTLSEATEQRTFTQSIDGPTATPDKCARLIVSNSFW